MDRLLVHTLLESHEDAPDEIVLDLDATDDAVHGRQEGRLFLAYFGCNCYLSQYILCDAHLPCALLRRSNFEA